ncbi:uncharacterized protein METZ01_LOCUS231280 [marine metagenome]|uniref:Uncharacterized protein n=1 Tax=marine metagenome TaxID=408172 RepID=A0A382GTK3_9ZZZZ
MTTMLTPRQVRDIDRAISTVNNGGECGVYFGYSGRGMFGATCIGIELDTIAELYEFGMELTSIDPDLSKALGAPRTDDLGLGIIAYWPSHDADEIELI